MNADGLIDEVNCDLITGSGLEGSRSPNFCDICCIFKKMYFLLLQTENSQKKNKPAELKS